MFLRNKASKMSTKISETGFVGVNTYLKIFRKPRKILKTSEAVLHPHIVFLRNMTSNWSKFLSWSLALE